MHRRIVFGDIHGGLRALKQLLDKIDPVDSDEFIFLGDYVDGWSESAPLIDFLIEFGNKQKCQFILGNHDAWCMEWLQGTLTNPAWLIQGGASTVESYDTYSPERKRTHLQFFQSTHTYWEDNEGSLFIHAGFTSDLGPSAETKAVHCWDRSLWEIAFTMHKRTLLDKTVTPKRLRLYERIFIGHTPTIRFGESKPMKRINVVNVDTGAAFIGPLSALDINNGELWQSEPVWQLYPHEYGRNSQTFSSTQ